ncbi:nickel/dipeptide/oligopeptide ABC transporter substrate-binding protein [Haloferula helveola]|uniref:Nickel/dipeptide/oligopeptide ABC transporter substrate-binding protein n=2 Tax=Haloferula helveola TaxID=490095 RepID=A0ABN6GYP5_9BACT|nr:nickel/dipeptide/oligopeptide ABC transporter substrate-binding protein [Haloferula helveola]
MRRLPWLLLSALPLLLGACREASDEYPPYDCTEERMKFYERYNEKTRADLGKRVADFEEALKGELTDAERKEAEQLLDETRERLRDPDFFQRKSVEDLPADLEWEFGMDQPELGSEEAKKGGTLHSYIPGGTYPPNIRSCGKEANNSFRSYHWDDIEMAQISLHPNTNRIIPGLADRWAVGEDGRSVFFHIDDEARWSDGEEVTSEDWMMSFYIYLSDYLSVAFYKNYYSEQFWGITTYGKDYLCIRNAFPKPLAPFWAAIPPSQAGFYKEFGPDFEERYNWRPRPTTGAYVIREEDIQKGRSISLSLVEDWWAKDRKYYKNRFNVDRIEYRQVRDEEKQFQMFLQGDIDIYYLNDAKKWYEQTEVDAAFKGYFERATFYNDYPRVSRGLYFNLSKKPLDNPDVRIGLSHATNWRKVIDLDLRGDAERLNLLNEGFGDISNPDIRARDYSVRKAREAFARAGYTKSGPDGILENDKGRRLSFTITTYKIPAVEAMMLRLKEEARRAGVEYKIEALDPTSAFQKTSRKEHQISFSGWAITPPFPDYYQQFHSKEAYIPGTKKPRPMTNNLSIFADPEVDKILEANRNARSYEVIKNTSRELEQIFHDRAVWIPSYQRPFYRLGYWRWVRWPDDFNVRLASEPEMTHLHWIDQDMKQDTLAAMREGRVFGEKILLFDQYRTLRKPEKGTPEADEGTDAGGESAAPSETDGTERDETPPAVEDEEGADE